MPTTIEVNKQSVEALLGSGKSKPFVIPEYQRPYAWTDEQVEQEVERILNDESAGMPMDNPEDLTQMEFGNNNQVNEEDLSDVKSEGKEGIEE